MLAFPEDMVFVVSRFGDESLIMGGSFLAHMKNVGWVIKATSIFTIFIEMFY